MIKKTKISKEDIDTWQNYINNPTDIIDKDKLLNQNIFNKMGLFKGEKHPNAELLANKGFYLPCGLGIKQHEIEYVANCLLRILKD